MWICIEMRDKKKEEKKTQSVATQSKRDRMFYILNVTSFGIGSVRALIHSFAAAASGAPSAERRHK